LAKLWLLAGKVPSYDYLHNPASHCEDVLIRTLSQHQSVAQHAGLLLWPSTLAVDWSWGSVPLITSALDPRNMFPIALYVALLGATVESLKGGGAFLRASLLWLVVPFLPSSNAAFPVGFILAERILYAPSVGFCMGLAYTVCRVFDRASGRAKEWCPRIDLTRLVMCILIAAYAKRSVDHVHDFRSEEALFLSGVRAHPGSPNMHYYLGTVYFYRENKTKADRHALETAYTEALRLLPSHAETLSNYAIYKFRNGDLEDAERMFALAVESEPHIRHRRENYAVFLASLSPPRLCDALAVFGAASEKARLPEAPYIIGGRDERTRIKEEPDAQDFIEEMVRSQGISCDAETKVQNSGDERGERASPARLLNVASGWFSIRDPN